MGNISIASTQKAGEGDAFILDNAGATRNIGILSRLKMAEDERNQQEKQVKQKQDYDTQKQFIDNLSSINTLGIRSADLPVINSDIEGLLKTVNDAKMQGKSPFDMSNVQEYMQLQSKLGQIQTKVDASKTWQKQLIAAEQALKQDKEGKLDYGKTMEAIKQGYTNPFDDMVGYNVEPVLAKYSVEPLTDKTYGDNLKFLAGNAKVLQDQGLVDQANDAIQKGKTAFIQSALGLHNAAISQGRITPEAAAEQLSTYFDATVRPLLYDPTTDEKQKLEKDKFKETQDRNKVLKDLGYGHLRVAQRNATTAEKKVAQSETVPLNVREIVDKAIAGSGNAVELINKSIAYTDGKEADQIIAVVKGDGRVLKNKLTGSTYTADPNANYLVIKKSDGTEYYQPTDENAIQSFIDSKVGPSVNKFVQVDEVSEETVKPISFGTNKQENVGARNSTSSSTRNNTSSSNSSTTTVSEKKTPKFKM